MFLFPSKPTRIYDPAQTIKTLTEVGKVDDWVVQVKKNGCRTNPEAENGTLKMWGRDHTILGVSREYDWSPLMELFPAPFLLDGELIGRKQAEQSNRLYLWDCPILDGVNLIGRNYDERYQILWNTFYKNATAMGLKVNCDFDWRWVQIGGIRVGVCATFSANMWKETLEIMMKKYDGSTGEIEGLVFKNKKTTMSWGATKEIRDQLKYLIKYR